MDIGGWGLCYALTRLLSIYFVKLLLRIGTMSLTPNTVYRIDNVGIVGIDNNVQSYNGNVCLFFLALVPGLPHYFYPDLPQSTQETFEDASGFSSIHNGSNASPLLATTVSLFYIGSPHD